MHTKQCCKFDYFFLSSLGVSVVSVHPCSTADKSFSARIWCCFLENSSFCALQNVYLILESDCVWKAKV